MYFSDVVAGSFAVVFKVVHFIEILLVFHYVSEIFIIVLHFIVSYHHGHHFWRVGRKGINALNI